MICAIPCALSPREVGVLQRYARGRWVVEAGALLGGSTVILAQVAAHVVSIDRHVGYRGLTLRPYLANLDRCGVRPRVTVRVGAAVDHLARTSADLGSASAPPPPDHDTLSRLLLTHPGDPDRWAAAVARRLGLPDRWARETARRVAVEGDGVATRLAVLGGVDGCKTPTYLLVYR